MRRLIALTVLALLLPAPAIGQTGGGQPGGGAGHAQTYPGGFRTQRDNSGNSGILYRSPGNGFPDYQYFPPVSARSPVVPPQPAPGRPAPPAGGAAPPATTLSPTESIVTQTPGLIPQLQLER